MLTSPVYQVIPVSFSPSISVLRKGRWEGRLKGCFLSLGCYLGENPHIPTQTFLYYKVSRRGNEPAKELISVYPGSLQVAAVIVAFSNDMIGRELLFQHWPLGRFRLVSKVCSPSVEQFRLKATQQMLINQMVTRICKLIARLHPMVSHPT